MPVVVLSGGQDSTTCLYWTIQRYGKEDTRALTFIYGQRHIREVQAAEQIADMAGVEHEVMRLNDYARLVDSALTRDVKIETRPDGLPNTFVPGRNLVFASIAASYAASHGDHAIVMGVCQADYSGYPDCRLDTIESMQRSIQLGLGSAFFIYTPLMFLTKAETVKLARELPGCWDALKYTVTCYNGSVPGCGACPACALRTKGFKEAGYLDPARWQS